MNTTSGQTGCNPGQLDVGIRKASFRFAPGETVTQMALFAGPDNSGKPNARAGAIRFATSLVRPPASLCDEAQSCCPIQGQERSTCRAGLDGLPLSLACSPHDVPAFAPGPAPNSGLRFAPAVTEQPRPGTCRMPGCCLHIMGWCSCVKDLEGAEKATEMLGAAGATFRLWEQ